MTIQLVELWLIVPCVSLFVLFILPLPVFSRLASKIVIAVDRVNISGVSVLTLITILAFAAFVNQVRVVNGHASALSGNLNVLENYDLKLNALAKKWKAERDLYIHAILFISLASINRIARLVDRIRKSQ